MGGGGGGGGGWRCLEMGGFHIILSFFLEIPHDAAQEKNLIVFIFPLLTNMRYTIIA